jgi:hypothetical protein
MTGVAWVVTSLFFTAVAAAAAMIAVVYARKALRKAGETTKAQRDMLRATESSWPGSAISWEGPSRRRGRSVALKPQPWPPSCEAEISARRAAGRE